MTELDTALAGLNPLFGRLRFDGELESRFREDYVAKSLPPMRIALALGAVLYALFGILDAWVVPEVAHRIWIIRYAVAVPILLTTLAYSFHPAFPRWMQRVLPPLTLVLGLGILAMIAMAGELGRERYYAGLILVIAWDYTLARLTFGRATVVGWALLGMYEVVALAVSPVSTIVLLNNTFFFASANVIGMFACYYTERSLRLEYVQRRIVDFERHRSETLLRNVLPEPVAERLKRSGERIADSFPDVTVLFCDIVDFTSLCEKRTPLETVTLLNEVFTALDELAAKHGLEKIKTIGDSYMIVAGAPVPRPDHADAIAEFALEAQQVLARFERGDGAPLRIRMGIHTGGVVAGVLGSTKLTYDVWGDTVNTASRIERHGLPGTIQVSQATYERLAARYAFAARGAVHAKGKGELHCWTLLARAHVRRGAADGASA